LDGGRAQGNIGRRTGHYDATVANYRQTTLVAFQEVEDNLAALRILEHEAGQQKEAVAEARRGVAILRIDTSLVPIPTFRLSPPRLLSCKNERNEVDILRRRMDASILLIKALGGGWDVSKLPEVKSMR